MITEFIQALTSVTPLMIVLIFVGVAIGIVFGSIPGLTATMAIVMFLPMTYTMNPANAMSLLMALYIGGISGGLISAILLNMPGTPSSIATCFDGHPMAKRGEAGKALGTGILFSFIGTVIGIICLVIMAPALSRMALKFGAYEYLALSIFSYSLVVVLTGKDVLKGIISVILGNMLAAVGMSPIDSVARFTLGDYRLLPGFTILVFLIGLFAIAEVIRYAEGVRKPERFEVLEGVRIRGFGVSLKEVWQQKWNALRSSIIGLGIGILPGIGGSISCMLSYTVAKNSSKHPEKFGTGVIDGVVASEAANNATIGGAMIPLLSLGIPGDGATAVLLGALMIHGVVPGPLIFQNNADTAFAVFVAMLIAAAVMVIEELFGLKLFVKVLKIPKNLLFPVIIMLCTIGAIGESNRLFDAWCILIFGLLGYGLSKAGIPLIPMILGFILGDTLELNLRKASMLVSMNPTSIVQHPIAIVLFAVTLIVFALNIRSSIRRARAAAKE